MSTYGLSPIRNPNGGVVRVDSTEDQSRELLREAVRAEAGIARDWLATRSFKEKHLHVSIKTATSDGVMVRSDMNIEIS